MFDAIPIKFAFGLPPALYQNLNQMLLFSTFSLQLNDAGVDTNDNAAKKTLSKITASVGVGIESGTYVLMLLINDMVKGKTKVKLRN